MKLKLGIVGIPGDWQNRYMPALRVLNGRFEVAGIYSSVFRLAENVAHQFDTAAFSSFRELISAPEIDAVLVLANDWYGQTPIHAACEYGKAVYCGSAIDFAPGQASELAGAVEKSGIAFMAEFPRRYAPASLRLKELIATQLGEPELMFCHRRVQQEASGVKAVRSRSSQLRREQMELVDWCSFIMGRRPVAIQCTLHQTPATPPSTVRPNATSAKNTHACEGETKEHTGDFEPDYAAFSLHFEATESQTTAPIAQVSCGSYIDDSWKEAIAFRPPSSLQVCCKNGLAFVDLPNSITWFDNAGRHQESLESEIGVGQQLLSQFHRAVTSLVRKMGDLDDVAHSLKVLDAAKQSVNEQRTICL